MSILERIGQFFLLLGLMILIIFIVLDTSGDLSFQLVFFGVAAVVLGIILIRKGATPSPPSERFRLFRRRDSNNQEQ
ncbi:MAG: hypothetical protein PVG14_18670 [Anaerolineales bacterium]|jgi:hypothetical protein